MQNKFYCVYLDVSSKLETLRAMTQFTCNNQKEHNSVIELTSLIQPWLATKFDYDFGIDLYIQPFIENNKSLSEPLKPFPKRLLVQLKSTDKTDKNEQTYSIDTQHLKDWINQKDLVVFMKYCITKKTFYYLYIDETITVNDTKYQTLYLNNELNATNVESFKNEVLNKLIQVEYSEVNSFPSVDGKSITYEAGFDLGTIETAHIDKSGNIFGNKKIEDAIKNLKQNIFTTHAINNLKREILLNDTVEKRLLLINELYIENKINDAKNEALALYNKYNSVEARVILYALNNKINLSELPLFLSVFYLKWDRIIPENTSIKVVCTVDGVDYHLIENVQNLLIIPVDSIQNIQCKMIISGENKESPSIKKNSVILCESFQYKEKIIKDFEKEIYIIDI